MLNVLQELDRAKRTVNELESELKGERARLRELTTEQSKAERQKEKVVLQLRRTESVGSPFTLVMSPCSHHYVGHGRHQGAACENEARKSNIRG